MPAPGEHLSLAERASITEAYLSAIVQFSDDAIIGKTLDGTIVSWNPGAERLYQYTAQEIIGSHISLLTPPEHLSWSETPSVRPSRACRRTVRERALRWRLGRL